MKRKLFVIPLIFLFYACQKDPVNPATSRSASGNLPTEAARVIKADTLPDQAYFKLQMLKDSSNYDETVILFDHRATAKYDPYLDAHYLPGWGAESLFSISDDGVPLAIYRLPYQNRLTIKLDAESKADGLYQLKISDQKNLSQNLQIWLKDARMKDSINLCSAIYRFQINKIDTTSYGKNRFTICLREVR